MAMGQSDGSIVLSTQVDTSGLNRGLKQLKRNLTSLASAMGLVFSLTKLVEFSKASAEFATQTEASVQRLIDIYGKASNEVREFIDSNARALGMSKASAASFASVYGNLFGVWADQSTNARLTAEYLNMTAVVASKTGRAMEDVQERIRSGLLGNTEAIEDLGIFVNLKTIEMTEAFKRVADGRSWEQLNAYEQSQVRTLAILEQSTQKYGNQVVETSATMRNQYNAAYEDFKNTWGQAVNLILLPVLNLLTQIFTIATAGINALMGKSGSIVDNVEAVTSNIGDSVENQKALTDEVEQTGKALKKTLAGFDDLQILSSGASEETSGSTGGGAPPLEIPATDFRSVANEVSEGIATLMGLVGVALVAIGLMLLYTGNIPLGIGFIIAGAAKFGVTVAGIGGADALASAIENTFAEYGEIVAGLGVALIVIGIILCATGAELPLGVGLISMGAMALTGAVMVNWDSIVFYVTNIFTSFGEIVAGLGAIMIVIGIILCCATGGVGLGIGIGLIVAGAAFVVGAIVANWDSIVATVKNIFTEFGGLIAGLGAALIVLGIILCCTGVGIGLGIGLIVAGAAFVVGAIVANWDSVVTTVKNIFTEFGGLIAGLGAALIVLGIILCCTGVGIGLGIGLIVAGAAFVVGAIVANWDSIVTTVKNVFTEFGGLIAGLGAALIVLGIILCCTGVGIGLGIGLIVAGAAAIGGAVAVNWDSIVEWVKSAWKAVKTFWQTHISKYFTAAWWLSLGKTCINGLIAGFEGGINAIIGAFESMINWFVNGLNKISFDIPDWIPGIGGKEFGFNLDTVKFNRVSIPRLAAGAVIPANKEFLAVLGDQKHGVNIETPLETMLEAFNTALDSRGDAVREEHYYLSETELMSILYRLVKGGERLNGNSLVNGGGF